MIIAEDNAMGSGMEANLAEASRPRPILPIGGRRISASHAARELGVSSDTVIRRIKEKSLKGYVDGGRYFTTDAWLTAYFLRNNKTLRQKKLQGSEVRSRSNPSLVADDNTQQRGGC